MTSYVALLRAVNVGGTGKLPMTDLRAMCEEAGFGKVQTYIASGNVLFADGHVEFLNLPTIQHILNELNTGHNPPSSLTPTLSQAAAEKDYQTNWKPRMPQLKSGVWHIPTTQPAKPQ